MFLWLSERSRRHESWEFIKFLATQSSLPWCILGDFNDMMYASDKKGTHAHPQHLFNGFCKTIEDCHLIELDLAGGRFTWEKSRGSSNWIRERLDRAFASEAWWTLFPLCNLTVITQRVQIMTPSSSIFLALLTQRSSFIFRFENAWLKEESFTADVSKTWRDLYPSLLLPKLLSVTSFMAKWDRNFFHKFRNKIKKKKEEFAMLVNFEDEEGVRKYFEASTQLNDLLLQEELYWKQRAKAF